jgi:hypothetical protein
MGTIVVPNVVKREPGYLYYIDKFGSVCRAKMKSKKNKDTKD